MTRELKRILIAEVCGYQERGGGPEGSYYTHDDRDGKFLFNDLPNYFNDLNAMHEAEKIIGLHDRSNALLRVKWINTLRDAVGVNCPKNKSGSPLCSDVDLLNATAAQRAEAFGRTLGLWV